MAIRPDSGQVHGAPLQPAGVEPKIELSYNAPRHGAPMGAAPAPQPGALASPADIARMRDNIADLRNKCMGKENTLVGIKLLTVLSAAVAVVLMIVGGPIGWTFAITSLILSIRMGIAWSDKKDEIAGAKRDLSIALDQALSQPMDKASKACFEAIRKGLKEGLSSSDFTPKEKAEWDAKAEAATKEVAEKALKKQQRHNTEDLFKDIKGQKVGYKHRMLTEALKKGDTYFGFAGIEKIKERLSSVQVDVNFMRKEADHVRSTGAGFRAKDLMSSLRAPGVGLLDLNKKVLLLETFLSDDATRKFHGQFRPLLASLKQEMKEKYGDDLKLLEKYNQLGDHALRVYNQILPDIVGSEPTPAKGIAARDKYLIDNPEYDIDMYTFVQKINHEKSPSDTSGGQKIIQGAATAAFLSVAG